MGDFVSQTTHFGLGTRALFFGPGDTVGKPAYMLPALTAGKIVTVRVEVSNLWEAGEYEAPLRMNGTLFAQIRGIKYRLPFAVKLDVPGAGVPEIRFERRHVQEVVLKNEDPVTYQVKWELTMEGSAYQGELELSPNGSASFKVAPEKKWFSLLTSLLKDDDRPGKLSLSFQPPHIAVDPHWPHKVIPFTAHLSYATGFGRDAASFFVVFALLVIGAIVSFAGHVGVPNAKIRSRLRDDLRELARRIGGVSRLVDSRSRVLVGVERRRLDTLLNSLFAISADLTDVFSQVRAGIGVLKQQVTFLERIDTAQEQLTRMAEKEMPPTALRIVRDKIWEAASRIDTSQPSEDDLKVSNTLLESVDTRLGELAESYDKYKPDDDTRKLVERSLKSFRKVVNPFHQIDLSLLGEPGVELHSLHALFTSLVSQYGKPDSFSACARLDNLTSRIQSILDFLELFRSADKEYRTRLAKEFPRLLKWLSQESWDSLIRAQRVVRQMQEGVFPSDLLESHAAAQIDCGPDLVFPNERIQFRVKFQDPRFSGSSARYDLQADWYFGDGLTESGWETSHYYPKHNLWKRWWRRWQWWHGTSRMALDHPEVEFKFSAADHSLGGAKAQSAEIHKKLRVQPGLWFPGLRRDRNKVELLRFFLALTPAIFGLVAGAKEQLLKGDLWTGILSVLLLGFGSDTVKNLISDSQQRSPAAPSPAAPSPPTPAVAAQSPSKNA